MTIAKSIRLPISYIVGTHFRGLKQNDILTGLKHSWLRFFVTTPKEKCHFMGTGIRR